LLQVGLNSGTRSCCFKILDLQSGGGYNRSIEPALFPGGFESLFNDLKNW
jgi:hypothetical protein